MNASENITAWFTDAASRHPDILHTATNKRFMEMEWDEILQGGKQVALPHFALVLEDYEQGLDDNGGDYVTRRPHLAFMVLRHVKPGALALKKSTYEDAQRIAEEILAKLHTDYVNGPCEADLPAGISPPAAVLLSTVKSARVGPVPAFDNAYGFRIAVDIRTNDDVDLSTSGVAWVPLT